MEFRLPDVGEGIDAAEIIEWHVAVGEQVVEDQPLVDIQTDKAIVAIPCPTTGVVAELRAQVGETIPVGAVLAVFESSAKGAGGLAAVVRSAAAERPDGPVASAAVAAVVSAAVAATPPSVAAAQPAPAAASSGTGKPLASPAVRRLARENGIALALLAPGSGSHGRITREDVERALALPSSPGSNGASAALVAPARADARREDEVVPLKGTRRAIARTLTQAWQTIPHVIDYREVDATGLVAARKALKAAAGDGPLAKALTVTPLLMKMCALALRAHPRVNASIDMAREEIILRGAVNIGVAIAAPDGLIVPVVHDADRKSVHELAIAIAELTVAARERRLTPEQLAGGTFTLNNYGGLGIWLGTPIIPPPQVANFGVGKLEERAVVRDGQIVIRPMIPVACSGDHRLLDGDTLAYFVSDVVRYMEDPALLVGELR